MAKKKTILRDSFEQITELGKEAVKKPAKTIKNIALDVGTAKALEHLATGDATSIEDEKAKKNSTPLDIDKLKKNYEEQDVQKEASLKARLFQLSRQAEEQVLEESKHKKLQKEQQTVQEEEEKKRKEEEKKKQMEQGPPLPSGKKRRSIFSPKKKAQEQHAETRPASGKQ